MRLEDVCTDLKVAMHCANASMKLKDMLDGKTEREKQLILEGYKAGASEVNGLAEIVAIKTGDTITYSEPPHFFKHLHDIYRGILHKITPGGNINL